eukprot:1195284-Prorocentrum_minimum.AAC.11
MAVSPLGVHILRVWSEEMVALFFGCVFLVFGTRQISIWCIKKLLALVWPSSTKAAYQKLQVEPDGSDPPGAISFPPQYTSRDIAAETASLFGRINRKPLSVRLTNLVPDQGVHNESCVESTLGSDVGCCGLDESVATSRVDWQRVSLRVRRLGRV